MLSSLIPTFYVQVSPGTTDDTERQDCEAISEVPEIGNRVRPKAERCRYWQ